MVLLFENNQYLQIGHAVLFSTDFELELQCALPNISLRFVSAILHLLTKLHSLINYEECHLFGLKSSFHF